ncbi:hypothetical protein [Actinoplanes sp. URMC 104]|uniref:hypothetical protein n=1 Tax=Actinoplanes sp. URMC 104 TaxID=3423409 RepID=UPI003F1A1302
MTDIVWGAEFDDPAFEPPEDPWASAEQVAAKAIEDGRKAVPLANLPEEFWGARQLFKDIRQAAHATVNSADAVLGSVLARASGMVSHELKFDSGRGPNGCMNLFVALVAPSGVGKTTAVQCADDLVRPPRYLSALDGHTDMDRFRDGVGLGTGEGIAEVFMGTAERPTGVLHTRSTKYANAGDPVMEKVRGQVRHNAFLYLDEGQTLSKMMKERQGTTIGAAIRTAWTGQALGQANAQEATTRFVGRNTYSLGMVIGYQPAVAQDLLADGGPGTPQRFLWLSALDPDIPEVGPFMPDGFQLPLEGPDGLPRKGVVAFPEAFKAELRRAHVAKVSAEVVVDELDSHEPLMLCKLSSLLCALDGRMVVSDEDIELARMLWRVSCATRDRLMEFGRQEAARRKAEKLADRVAETEAVSLAAKGVDHSIDRVARLIFRRVQAHDGPALRYLLRKNIGSANKPFFDAALAHAASVQWVALVEDDRAVVPGSAVPA